MTSPSLKTTLAAGLLGFAALGAQAQTGTAAPAGGQPSSVGVSPQTAAEANQRAVPRSDVGTVVRTAPSATDRARDAAGNAGTNGAGSAGTAAAPAPAPAPAPMPARPARADRN